MAVIFDIRNEAVQKDLADYLSITFKNNFFPGETGKKVFWEVVQNFVADRKEKARIKNRVFIKADRAVLRALSDNREKMPKTSEITNLVDGKKHAWACYDYESNLRFLKRHDLVEATKDEQGHLHWFITVDGENFLSLMDAGKVEMKPYYRG